MKDKLSPEEIRLWQSYVKDVKPFSRKLPEPEEPIVPQLPLSPKPSPKKSVKRVPPIAPLQIFGRKELRHVKIDARLDMHGMTLEKGYDALEQFMKRSQERGFKYVLVITGKGALSAEKTFRHQMPGWLEEARLRSLITGFHHPAQPQDGGSGAFYVGVRKRAGS